jgi:hypothetical protein
MNKHATLLAITLATGCLSPMTQAAGAIARLHSIGVEQDMLVFTVTSHGCTRDEDFELRVEPGEVQRVTLIRLRPDLCKRVPLAKRIRLPLTEHGLSLDKPFAVSNPLLPPPAKFHGGFNKIAPANKAGK